MNAIWLAVALALCVACGAPMGNLAAAEDVTAGALAQAAADSQEGWEALGQLDLETRDFYLNEVYELPEGSWSDAAIIAANGVDAREIAVIRVTGEGDEVREALSAYKKEREGAFTGYAPNEETLVSVGSVRREGEWVALLICWEILPAWNAILTELGAEPITASESAEKPIENNGWAAFTPPNVHDMCIFNNEKILEKWSCRGAEKSSGGPEKDVTLSEKEQELYNKCETILESLISVEMTDFEKELAIHDWLMDNCVYDESVYDPATPDGQAGSLEPYGPILYGRGICLGYATAFELLLDMAGVECMTVVGASAGSTQDHAWNMVKLEGEWYCVDPTWDDPTAYNSSLTYKQSRHRYFNVTSDHMRQTNHQWDYTKVPEATADRFRWDGASALPQ